MKILTEIKTGEAIVLPQDLHGPDGKVYRLFAFSQNHKPGSEGKVFAEDGPNGQFNLPPSMFGLRIIDEPISTMKVEPGVIAVTEAQIHEFSAILIQAHKQIGVPTNIRLRPGPKGERIAIMHYDAGGSDWHAWVNEEGRLEMSR